VGTIKYDRVGDGGKQKNAPADENTDILASNVIIFKVVQAE
jgi:hypothetical protein